MSEDPLFRVQVEMPESTIQLKRSDALLSLGSCFSQRIGERLNRLKFNIEVDPFGVLYDPVSMANALNLVAANREFTAHDLQNENGRYFSFAHSTLFSGSEERAVLEGINSRIGNAHEQFADAPVVMLTLGTAWAFRHIGSDSIVTNCHKLPGKLFQRELLSVETIVEALSGAMEDVLKVAPNARFLFTVSPVKHLRDGLINDQLGKSTLFVALHELRKAFPGTEYFPAFELLQHELRDHRFYAEDMAHPSKQAEEYIWKKFEANCIDGKELGQSRDLEQIHALLGHRPLSTEPAVLREHERNVQERINDLSKRFPALDLSTEKELAKSG